MADLQLLKQSLRDMLRPKTISLAGLIVALPLLIAVGMRFFQGGQFNPAEAYDTLSLHLVFGFSLVILSVVLGTGVITQEVEQKTIVYLLTRPVPRWRILAVKFLAAFILILVTVWAEALALALGTFGPGKFLQSSLPRDLAILPVGIVAYGSASLALATMMSKPLIPGLLYAFLWESWVPLFPGSFKNFSLIAYVRALAPHSQPESDFSKLEDTLSQMGVQSVITPSFAWKVLVLVSVITLALALIVFSNREYVPREETT
jgi:ABC-2 type transport system permease protein